MSRPVKDLTRYKKILELRHPKGGKKPMKFQEIGDVLGISRQRVWQIYNRAIKRIPHVKDVTSDPPGQSSRNRNIAPMSSHA